MTLQAGAATRDITPASPQHLVGYPHVERTSTGVHDPLLAAALCLADGDDKVILVAVDILFIDPPTAGELRGAIAAGTRVPDENVFISCTHTHSGPVTAQVLAWRADPVVPGPDPGYMRRFKAAVVEAATASADRLRPAELAWTTARARGVGGNRHDPAGPSDPEVGILLVRDAPTHRPLALAMVYAMHPTVLHEDSTLVSADFPGYTRRHLAEALGEDVVVLYHTGPSGNQSPRHHVRGQTFAEAERLGRTLGQCVADSVARLLGGSFVNKAVLRGATRPVDLPPRRVPSVREAQEGLRRCREQFDRLKRDRAPHGRARTAECDVFGAEGALALARAEESGELADLIERYRSAQVQVLRIDDGVLVGLPGELFVEYGLAIKAGSARPAFPVSLVNGELQGYIVTEAAAAGGCYEAGVALFAPAAGPLLVEAALQLIQTV